MNYFREKYLHKLFEKQAAKTPEAIAVSTGSRSITYKELNCKANRLANYLQVKGIKPEMKVGICLERTIEMVVGVLAILKAGGAYVPLDIAYPQQRLSFMLEDAKVSILLSQQKLLEKLPTSASPIFCFDRDWKDVIVHSDSNPIIKEMKTSILAYVIYTSGSTGKPKGVAIEHRSTLAFIDWAKSTFTLKELSSVLASTSLCFDLSVFELFVPLSVGGKVVLVENALALSAMHNLEIITLINTVPSVIVELLRIKAIPSSVCTINLAGETLQAGIAERIYQETEVEKVYNLYGPTEATTYSTFALIERGSKNLPPIGKPINNTQVNLLDSHLNPVAYGTPGEIYISGAGLARGYLNRPNLTAEKFILSPSGIRLYKTGDLGCYLSNGNLKFLKRIDHQAKIRGFRIELGEIESVLSLHHKVERVAVKVHQDKANNNYLVAYIVAALQSWKSQNIDNIKDWNTQQVSRWQKVFNRLYQEVPKSNSTLNVIGWNNTYTGMPFSQEEMKEWIDNTVKSILSLKPNRILEIGCGTGLLLFRLLDHCKEYCGTDISQSTLSALKQRIEQHHLQKVTLLERAADDFSQIAEDSFDIVVLNSVVQYFPNIDYLIEVLEQSLKTVAPGGFIFLGDIRSFPLLETFHASIELYNAPPSRPTEQIKQRIQKRVIQEEELFIAPAFFTSLKQRFPQISHVEISPKSGMFDNELTRFRYQVVIRVQREEPIDTPVWVDWQIEQLNLEKLQCLLIEKQPDCLGVTQIPNAYLSSEAKILDELAENQEKARTAKDLKKR
uniref:Nonribosomal peptide synthetase (A-NMT) n=1 Tax=Prochloron didemni P3-Solomon TaxID=910458 RepID=G0XS81_PRODI|nr:nonribosomal peptide synthetase (A-NMT) [Prochloron didemni P3-Solomon]